MYEWLNNPKDYPFHKLARHSTLLLGLIFSYILIRLLGLQKESLLGFNVSAGVFCKQFIYGLLIGCLVLFITETLLILSSVHIFDNTIDLSAKLIFTVLLKGLITGLIVGFLEEILFRGTLYKAIENSHSTTSVIVLISAIYAAVHFIDFPVMDETQKLHWLSGPSVLPEAFAPLLTLGIWDTFLTLFLLGVLLAIFRASHQNIIYCIGIHAGVIMMVKLSRKLTNYNTETNWGFLVNNTDQQLGLAASIVLGLFCLYFFYSLKRTESDSY